MLFAHLSLTTAQCQTKFVFQLVKIREFPLYVGQFFQPSLHGRTRLQAITSQPQKSADLAELESEPLNPADKGQRLHVVFQECTKKPLPYLQGISNLRGRNSATPPLTTKKIKCSRLSGINLADGAFG